VANWTKDFDNGVLMHQLQKAGVAAGQSLDIKELVADPHCQKRGVFVKQHHKVAGDITVYRSPWASAQTAKNPPAPCLGEHNDYVFKKLLKKSDSEIKALTEAKVIY
jgi:crotonobetainyl-CoA:carnitine CoA-transferase CaiB-like acyl-CoA transferase